ncbi:MAG TPA: hypothetical protein VGK31_08350 [Thermoanaerobaculia bacterium]
MEFECPWCHLHISVEHYEWTYVQSVAILHFHACNSRPVNLTADTIEANAERVADQIEDEYRAR